MMMMMMRRAPFGRLLCSTSGLSCYKPRQPLLIGKENVCISRPTHEALYNTHPFISSSCLLIGPRFVFIKNSSTTTPIVPSSAKQAVEQMRDKTYDPYALSVYFRQTLFRTIVDASVKTAGVRDYYAGLFNPGPGDIVSFQHTQPYAQPIAPIRVWFVPRVSVERLENNKDQFPDGTLATIDLGKTQAPFICTEKLTGCCFVIGWDNKIGRLYLGHVEPASLIKDRTYVAKYVRSKEIFPVPKNQLKYMCLGGDDNELPSSYNNYTVNIIGFISSDYIWITFQVLHPESGQQVRESMGDGFP